MNRYSKRLIFLLFICFPLSGSAWGFFAHKEINRLAVFMLPPGMIKFYKQHLHYITENAVNPDKRRYAVKEEACRHFIDLDVYPDSIRHAMPKYWKEAASIFSEDTLLAYGIVPWHIYLMKFQLTEAFRKKDFGSILRLSTELGHYVGDANVPLHTTKNYNGQYTNQRGIHGFWESRLPELYSSGYDFFCGPAVYLKDVQGSVWENVYQAHAALDSVLLFEQELSHSFAPDKKYSMEERNGVNMKVYSLEYAAAYHSKLKDQVERQMLASVKLLGNIWYTCWIDAGQPDLSELYGEEAAPEKEKETMQKAPTSKEECFH